MDTQAVSRFIDGLLDRYPSGYVEVMASVSVQLVYLAFGLLVEYAFRPAYASETSARMLVQSMGNHIVATAVHVLYVAYRQGASVLTSTFERPYALPSWGETAAHLVAALAMREVLFYAVHRVWHMRRLYPWVHAKHHEILYPGKHHVLTISYMSTLDFLILYGMPVMAVAKILEMNIMTTMAFSLISAIGEQVKLIWGDEGHDAHHLGGGTPFSPYGAIESVCGRLYSYVNQASCMAKKERKAD